jgi:uncharacterized protein (DUF927 family)
MDIYNTVFGFIQGDITKLQERESSITFSNGETFQKKLFNQVRLMAQTILSNMPKSLEEKKEQQKLADLKTNFNKLKSVMSNIYINVEDSTLPQDLKSFFKQKFHTTHPDKGGDVNEFIKYFNIYKKLL